MITKWKDILFIWFMQELLLPKNYFLFYRNSDGYQQENIIISIRKWDINISIRRCYIRCQNQKINLCLRWSLMNRSARNNLNSDQDNNTSSAPKQCQNKPKPEHVLVATVLCIQDYLLSTALFQTKIFSFWKECYWHWNRITDSNVPFSNAI